VKLFNSKELENKENPVLKPGEIKYLKPDLLVGTGTNTIQINQIQFEGRKILPVSQFISGYHKIIGERFD
jgi:methionyl-tRNA formyltransferase